MNILNSIKGKLAIDEQNDKAKVIHKEEESTVYDELKYVEKLCEKMVQVITTKNKKLHTLNHTEDALKSIDIYEKIDNDTLKKIDKLMQEYTKLKQSKDNLKANIAENSKKFEHLSHYSHRDIENELEDMATLEAEQAVIKKDLGHLSFEKDDILDSVDKLEKTSIFIRILLHFTIFAISLAAICFIYLISTGVEDIILPSSITTVVLIFWTTWVLLFRNKINDELTKYKKLQAREIQLSNKVKVKFANVTNVLDFKYKKYNVKSSGDLKKEWDTYQESLDKKYQYHRIFHEFFDIEEHLQKLLTDKGIIFEEDINMIEVISNIKDKMRLKEELENKLGIIKGEMRTLAEEQEKINENLKKLEAEDKTEQKIVRNLIESYFKDIKDMM